MTPTDPKAGETPHYAPANNELGYKDAGASPDKEAK